MREGTRKEMSLLTMETPSKRKYLTAPSAMLPHCSQLRFSIIQPLPPAQNRCYPAGLSSWEPGPPHHALYHTYLTGRKHFSSEEDPFIPHLETDMRWYRRTSGFWPCPSWLLQKIDPVLSGVRINANLCNVLYDEPASAGWTR